MKIAEESSSLQVKLLQACETLKGQHLSQNPELRVLWPEGAGASQLWAPKPEEMPGCLVSLGRRKACKLGMGVSIMFSPLILLGFGSCIM